MTQRKLDELNHAVIMHKLIIIHLIISHLMRQNYSIYQSLPIPIIFDRLKYLKLFLNLKFQKILEILSDIDF